MWYILLIFVFVAELSMSIVSPYFIDVSVGNFDTDVVASGISALDVTSGGLGNPLEAFIALSTFQVQGFEVLSVVFWILHFMLFLCLIKVAIDAVNALGQWIPFT